MTTRELVTASNNAAWVTIKTPLSADALAKFCSNIERLYRINPYYEYRFWREIKPGQWHAAYRNLSIGADAELVIALLPGPAGDFAVSYSQGIKQRTRFIIRPAPPGSELTIVDEYEDVKRERADRETDRSLRAWGVALHEYLYRYARWSWCAPWRWYMNHVWMPMKPSARRITYVILLITLAEIALFALVIAIWWAEHRS